jgi:hypothetical protein
MRINNIIAIARPIDPNYLTNRAIAAVAMVVTAGGAIFQLLTGGELIQSALWGIAAGFAVFLAWALGRELDPDHDLSAFVAAGWALIGVLFLDLPSIIVLLWILLLVRIVNRTVGLPARIFDSLLILGLAGWLTLQGNWIVGLMTALAFFLDGQLSPPHRRQLLFAGITVLVTVISFFLTGGIHGEAQLSSPGLLALLAVSALFVLVIIDSRELRTLGDQTSEPLNPRRVQAAQIIALLTGIQFALWRGDPSLVSLMPLWAAMLGVALYRLFVIIYRRWPGA